MYIVRRMKNGLILLLLFTTSSVMACRYSVLNSCRDTYTKHLSKSRIKRARKRVYRDYKVREQVDRIYKSVTRRTHQSELFSKLLKIPAYKEEYDYCMGEEGSTQKSCLGDTLSDSIYYAYSLDYIDATAAIILLTKFSSDKKAKVTGDLDSYANKIYLIRRSYEKRRGKGVSLYPSPISQKKYLTKIYGLKRLTPRQSTLMRFNYSQIKKMGQMMVEFDKRANALSSGVYYDYDGDGEMDEQIPFDPAEQYRLTVKLLLKELEEESRTGGIFAGKKPTWHDLLVSANELGLIKDSDLKSMIELPHLYEEKKAKWEVAAEIAWEVGKGVVMVIPGVNLYAIIPIVLVESYINSREQRNEPSDLHIISF
jgi:hypothetical protein